MCVSSGGSGGQPNIQTASTTDPGRRQWCFRERDPGECCVYKLSGVPWWSSAHWVFQEFHRPQPAGICFTSTQTRGSHNFGLQSTHLVAHVNSKPFFCQRDVLFNYSMASLLPWCPQSSTWWGTRQQRCKEYHLLYCYRSHLGEATSPPPLQHYYFKSDFILFFTLQENLTLITNPAVRVVILNRTLTALAPEFGNFGPEDYRRWFQLYLTSVLASLRPGSLLVIPRNISCASYGEM